MNDLDHIGLIDISVDLDKTCVYVFTCFDFMPHTLQKGQQLPGTLYLAGPHALSLRDFAALETM